MALSLTVAVTVIGGPKTKKYYQKVYVSVQRVVTVSGPEVNVAVAQRVVLAAPEKDITRARGCA